MFSTPSFNDRPGQRPCSSRISDLTSNPRTAAASRQVQSVARGLLAATTAVADQELAGVGAIRRPPGRARPGGRSPGRRGGHLRWEPRPRASRTTRAVLACRVISRRMASLVRPLAWASNSRPSKIGITMTAAPRSRHGSRRRAAGRPAQPNGRRLRSLPEPPVGRCGSVKSFQ